MFRKKNESTIPNNQNPEKIKPINCKVSEGMTRVYGVRKQNSNRSNIEFEKLLHQLTEQESN